MTAPTISTFPPAPVRGEDRATFTSKANALVAHYATFVTEMNDTVLPWIETQVATAESAVTDAEQAVTDATAQVALATTEADRAETEADRAEAAADQAASTSNYLGEWSTLSGAVSIPTSVSNNSVIWILIQNLADVTTVEPGVSANSDDYWLAVNVADPIGAIAVRSSEAESGWLAMNGTTYLQSAYPLLYQQFPQWSWDLSTQETLPSNNGIVRNSSAKSDSSEMAFCGDFTTAPARLHIIETTGFTRLSGTYSPVGNATDCHYSPDDAYLAVASVGSGGNNGLVVLDTADYTTVVHGGAGFGIHQCCRFSPDGNFLAVNDASNTIVYNVPAWTTATTIPGSAVSIAWAPDSSALAVALGASPFLEVYESTGWTQVGGTPTLAGATFEVNGIDWGDGFVVTCSTVSPYTVVYDDTDWSVIANTASMGSATTIKNVSIAPDGSYMALGNTSTTQIVEVPAFKLDSGFSLNRGDVPRFTPDNMYLMLSIGASPYWRVYNGKSLTSFTLPDVDSPASGTLWKVRGLLT